MQGNVIRQLLMERKEKKHFNLAQGVMTQRYQYVRNPVLEEKNNKIGHGLCVFIIRFSKDIPNPPVSRKRESKVEKKD